MRSDINGIQRSERVLSNRNSTHGVRCSSLCAFNSVNTRNLFMEKRTLWFWYKEIHKQILIPIMGLNYLIIFLSTIPN